VTDVKIFYLERPSALPAACALVPDASAPLAAAPAHALAVGNWAVQRDRCVSTSQIQPHGTQLQGRSVRAYEATGFTSLNNPMARKAVDVVGGVPPRGRPV
jgi:hypothetical protein